MILDIFSELQTARPPHETDPRALYEQAIEQAMLADELGYGCWWAVEHHTSPEFSWSSAPELVLTAIARHTRRIRLGTSGILSPFRINHPVRVAERGLSHDQPQVPQRHHFASIRWFKCLDTFNTAHWDL